MWTKKPFFRQPGVEPGAKAWEASMLPIHHWRNMLKTIGGTGFRSLCLPIANRPLYRVSYTPFSVKLSGKNSTFYGVRTHASFETDA